MSDSSRSEKEPKFHPKNRTNHLSGTDWVKFTKSWFVMKSRPRTEGQVQHPAKYPEELARQFIDFCTRRGDLVLDPFAGVGSTLLAAAQAGRHSVGLELNPKYVEIGLQHLAFELDISDPEAMHWNPHFVREDARQVHAVFHDRGFVRPQLVMCSPPYGNMLKTSRGFDTGATAHERARQGLDVAYSEDPNDLGNLEYSKFLETLIAIFLDCAGLLRYGGFLVIVVQNYRRPDGAMETLAFDLVRGLDTPGHLEFKGERIWCQDDKRLGIWGYPSELVINMHHHYCLIFRKPPYKVALVSPDLKSGKEMSTADAIVWCNEREPNVPPLDIPF